MQPLPRAYHHGNLPQALVSAAIDAISAAGDGNFNLRDIATRAGVSAAAPYKHFAGKAGLIAAVTAEIRLRLDATLAEAVDPRATARQNAHAVAEACLMFAAAQPVLFRLLCGAIPSGPPAMPVPHHRLQPVLAPLSGEVAVDAAASTAFWSLLTGLALLWLDGAIVGLSPAAVVEAALSGLIPPRHP